MIRAMAREAKPGEYVLAFETSGAVGSVAIGRGDEVLETYVFGEPRAHAVEFFPAIDRLCRKHAVEPRQIGHVYVSAGPGSFTGLRVGITAARTIGAATQARIVAVPTLEVIAQNAAEINPPPQLLAVMLDAKRGHVYASAFRRELTGATPPSGPLLYVPITEPAEVEPEEFLRSQEPACGVMGEGVLYHRAAVERAGRSVLPEPTYRPRAEVVYRLGRAAATAGAFVDRRDLIPVYIRPPEAEEKWKKRMSNAE
jgi:tRNA threonylcarbamoyladenosine biosynthesis protein TsaB